jgi:hypothetical protein
MSARIVWWSIGTGVAIVVLGLLASRLTVQSIELWTGSRSGSLAQLVADDNSAGMCPASPPAAPTPSSVTALFTALSGVLDFDGGSHELYREPNARAKIDG